MSCHICKSPAVNNMKFCSSDCADLFLSAVEQSSKAKQIAPIKNKRETYQDLLKNSRNNSPVPFIENNFKPKFEKKKCNQDDCDKMIPKSYEFCFEHNPKAQDDSKCIQCKTEDKNLPHKYCVKCHEQKSGFAKHHQSDSQNDSRKECDHDDCDKMIPKNYEFCFEHKPKPADDTKCVQCNKEDKNLPHNFCDKCHEENSKKHKNFKQGKNKFFSKK